MSVILENGYLNENILMLDANGWKNKKTTSSFIIIGKHVAILDPAGSDSADIILKLLDDFKIEKDSVRYIFVSHRHNDHSAGASILVKKLSKAVIYGHPITIENLKNPEKINDATRKMYGYLAEPIDPVKDMEKLVEIKDNNLFDLGNGISVRALYMPGHTSDHLMFQETLNDFIFTGDGAGLFSGKYMTALPNSFPPSFKYNEYKKSLTNLIEMKPKMLGFSHFGSIKGNDVNKVLIDSLNILEEWKEIISSHNDYENILFYKYKNNFDLFSENFRDEVLRIIINGFAKNL
ncbi:MAG: MBL fold metallo-hydrolase [Thermoplasmata archaeon]